MNTGKIIFSQVMDYLPMHTFRRCVQRYDGHYKVKTYIPHYKRCKIWNYWEGTKSGFSGKPQEAPPVKKANLFVIYRVVMEK